MSKRWLILFVAMVLPAAMVMTVSEPAQAQLLSEKQRKDQAKTSYASGKAKMDAGDYAGAVVDFQMADTMWPGAAPKYNVAYCYDKMGRTNDALAAYKRFLASNPDAKYADKVALSQQRIKAIEAESKAKATGKVILAITPANVPGVAVRIDGTPVAGLEHDLSAGPHSIEVTAPGYGLYSQQIDVVGSTRLDLPITLQPAPRSTPRSSSKGNGLIIAGFVVGGVGVVAGVLTTAFGVMALNSASDFDATPTEELADDTDRNALIADVFLPFAIVGVGAGAVMLGIGYSQKESASLRVSPMYARGGGGAVITVDF